jgi:hypothetical protein
VLLTVIEMVSYRIHPDEDAAGYTGRDTATSLSMGLGSLFTDASSRAMRLCRWDRLHPSAVAA